MSYIIFKAINSKEKDAEKIKSDLINDISKFRSDIESINILAKSKDPWNWRNQYWDFNSERILENPGYIGSYAMDAITKALHCVFNSFSFEQAVLKAISRGGDADSVAAITGQIAGAIYGLKNIPKEWIEAVQEWDRNGEIAARGYLLLNAR